MFTYIKIQRLNWLLGLPWWLDGKESGWIVGDLGSIPGLGRFPGEENGCSLQYSAWRIPWTEELGRLVHGVAKSQTQLNDFHFNRLLV